MSEGLAAPPAAVDRGEHLAALHDAWTTPPHLVSAAVAEVTGGRVLGLRRIVAGEQNEVYDAAIERAPSLIVRISHRGPAGHEREAWVLGQCAARGIPAPRIHGLRRITVGDESRSVMVMEKLPGERLSDIDPTEIDARRVLGEIGAWLSEFHAIPARGVGYLDGTGTGFLPSVDAWLAESLMDRAQVFEDAGRSAGLEAATVRGWLREIDEAFRAAPPRAVLIHNDLLANHVLVHEGRLSGIIDFGEVAAEPAAVDFARWEFNEGERFPVAWLRAGYRDQSMFEPPNDLTYRALRLATGLWLMRWYHETGFPAGVEAAARRLVGVADGARS